MKVLYKTILAALLVGAWFFPGSASAAFVCSINASPVTPTYQDNATTVSTQATLILSCTRAGGDPTTLSYSFDTPGPGANFSGTRRASASIGGPTYYVQYTLGTASGCASPWVAGTFTGTITWTNGGDRALRAGPTHTYWTCVPQQTGTGLAATNTNPPYSDTFAITATAAATTILNTTRTVSVTVTPVCTIPTTPGTISFSYTAFQAAAITPAPSTAFAVRCTTADGYTVDVSPTSGTAAGVNYTLDVLTSPGAVVVPPATTLTGTGSNQSYSIRATVPGGQSGCSGGACPTSQPHTLTISY